MTNLPGWKPMTALGVVLALTGLALIVVGVGIGLVSWAVGSESAGSGLAVIAATGFGFQFAVLGSGIAVLSLVGNWFARGVVACPLWRSPR